MTKWELEHPELSPFEPRVREIAHQFFRAGIEAFTRAGGAIDQVKGNPKARKTFLKLCHRGYDVGQSMIVEDLIGLVEQKRELTDNQKVARQARDKDKSAELENMLSILDTRETVLRSLADTIALLMLGDQKWIIRRYIHHEGPTAVSRTALNAAQRYARFENAARPSSFSLITDITSCIHAGDILKIDFTTGNARVRPIELKEGKINREIARLLHDSPQPTAEDLSKFEQLHGSKAIKQIKRVQNQQHRVKSTIETIKTERGKDVLTGQNFLTSERPLVLETWHEEFIKLLNTIKKRGRAAITVEGCLNIVGYQSRTGITPGVAAHLIYHRLIRDPNCMGLEEGDAIRNRVRMLFDFRQALEDCDYLTPWTFPGDHPDVVMDIIFGRTIIKLHIDPDRLIELSTEMELPLRWATRKEMKFLAESKQVSRPASFGGKALITDRDEPTMFVGPGMVKRVMFDFTKPSSLVRMAYHEYDRIRRMHATHDNNAL